MAVTFTKEDVVYQINSTLMRLGLQRAQDTAGAGGDTPVPMVKCIAAGSASGNVSSGHVGFFFELNATSMSTVKILGRKVSDGTMPS
jgi:hypothetical protein